MAEKAVSKGRYRVRAAGVMIYCALLMYFAAFLAGVETNLFTTYLTADFGWTRNMISVPITVGGLVSVFTAIFLSTLIMKVGVKKVIVPAMMLIGVGHMCIGLATNYTMYLAGVVLIQLVCPLMFICGPAIINNWFRETRGRVLGITSVATPLGTATLMPAITWLVETFNFTIAFVALGLFIVVLAIIIIFLLTENPEEIGFTVDGKPIAEKMPNPFAGMKSIWNFKRIFSQKEFWLFVLGFSLLQLVGYSYQSSIVSRFIDVGANMNIALSIMSVGAIISMPVSLGWGWLDDKIGTFKTCALLGISTFVGSVGLLILTPGNVFAYALVLIFFALFLGGGPNLQPSGLSTLFGRFEFVSANRYSNIIMGVCRSISFSIMSVFYGIFSTYTPVYYLYIVLTIIGVIMILAVKQTLNPMENPSIIKKLGLRPDEIPAPPPGFVPPSAMKQGEKK